MKFIFTTRHISNNMVVRVTRSSKKRVVFIKTQLQRRATGIASKISIVWSNIREVIPIVSQPRRRDRGSRSLYPNTVRGLVNWREITKKQKSRTNKLKYYVLPLHRNKEKRPHF